MEPETLAAIAALTVGLSGAAAAYGWALNATRKLDAARAKIAQAKGFTFKGNKASSGFGDYVSKAPEAKVTMRANPPSR